jgi:hypothetical protein
MSTELKPGDRVRVTVLGRRIGYESGDKGTVLWGPISSHSGQTFYLVSMDKDGPGNGVTFRAWEIEADA